MKILVFLQGTTLMHRDGVGHKRQEIVKQVIDKNKSVRDFKTYLPVANAVKKLKIWKNQGVEICYLSPLTDSKKAREDERIVFKEDTRVEKMVLDNNNFPPGRIYHRKSNENYKDVVEKIKPLPNIIVEDDCESIGKDQITYPTLKAELKKKIKSIIVKEFGGIDHLPDKLSDLLQY